MSDNIDFKLIGTQLQRLQQDVRELRYTVDLDRKEARLQYDLLRQDMHTNLATLETNMGARMDAFDLRFTYLDEAIGQVRQETSELRQGMTELREAVAEIKTLILAGQPRS